MTTAYEIAKGGGKHSGYLDEYRGKPDHLVARAIRSLQKQIALHQKWIQNPYLKINSNESTARLNALVNKKWPSDIRRLAAQIEVLKGILEERKS